MPAATVQTEFGWSLSGRRIGDRGHREE